MNIDTEFFARNEGLLAVRKKLGDARYATLKTLSDKMRALFDADPEDEWTDNDMARRGFLFRQG